MKVKGYRQIVRRYSLALIETVNDTHQDLVTAVQCVRNLLAAWQPEVAEVFLNPDYSEVQKLELMKTLYSTLNCPDFLAAFLDLILKNRRVEGLKNILEDFLERADEQMGICRVVLKTTRSVSPNVLVEFEQVLTQALDKRTLISNEIDATLRAGFVVRIKNSVIDNSLKFKLEALKNALIYGAQ